MSSLISYPLRINRYIALRGIATRRSADELIRQKRVRINGHIAKLGDLVQKADVVVVSEIKRAPFEYFAYNKPRGVISHSPQKHETDIRDAFGRNDLFPVGRLDKDSHGLIIVTNDGRITDRLLHPRHEHSKEYVITVQETVPPRALKLLERGIMLDGSKTKPCKTKRIGAHTFSIILHEGKKHQIRRMCDMVHLTITDLQRTTIMNIKLNGLRANEARPIEGLELTKFLHVLGL